MPFPALQAHRPHLGGLRGAAAHEPLGLYLHIPFCRDRCTYCSFATSRDEELKPLQFALQQIAAGGTARAGASAAVTFIIAAIPITFFLICQSNVLETMTTSGMKE